MLRRSKHGPFPNFYAFPGGALEPQDYQQSAIGGALCLLNCDDAAAYYHAACRETHEECDIQIPAAHHLAYFAHWCTPKGIPKRFDTRFFLWGMDVNQTMQIDDHEIIAANWMTPTDALAEIKKSLMPPTRDILRLLSPCRNIQEAMQLAAQRQQNGIPKVAPELSAEGTINLPPKEQR